MTLSLFDVLTMPPPDVRDPQAPCTAFKPGEPGYGDCDTDGHYRCMECVHMNVRTLELRRGQTGETVGGN